VVPALFSPFDQLREAVLARCPKVQIEDHRTHGLRLP
jgi:hypothetical protein